MIVTVEELWPINMRLFISYSHDVFLLACCSIDDRDSRVLWPINMRMSISFFHNMILLAGCSIDDHDCRSVMANEYETTG